MDYLTFKYFADRLDAIEARLDSIVMALDDKALATTLAADVRAKTQALKDAIPKL